MIETRAEYHAGSDPAPIEFTVKSEGKRKHKIMLGPLVYATAHNVDAAVYLCYLANLGLKAEREASQ